MDSSAKVYLEYNRYPTKGIKELFSISKHRIISDLEEELDQGNTGSNIVDPIYDFYIELMTYDYGTLALGIAREAYDKIKEFENSNSGQLVNKDKLFFLFALLNISTGNTIASTAYWELTINETNRINGRTNNIGFIITQMPTRFTSLFNAVKLRHDNNNLISTLHGYPWINNYEGNLNILSGLSLLSYLSSGIRNVQVNTFFDEYSHQIEVTKMYGQELVNNLSIVNETELKNDPRIRTQIPLANNRMIGRMLQVISHFNPAVHAILGNSSSPRSGLYIDSRFDFSSEANFNANYPHLINTITSGTLTEDELKAYILYGFHHIRNNVLHNLNSNLIYYNNTELFLKTIGLLFASISVIKSL